MPNVSTTATGSTHRRLRVLMPAIACSVVALGTACGGSTTSTATPASTAAGAAGSAAGGTTVTVTETDFALALDRSALAPGQYTFHTVNTGKTAHALELEGPGIDEQKTALLQPGQSGDFSVTLQAGDYDMYCPVDGHRGMGMERRLTVGGTGGVSPPTSSSGGGSGY